MKRILPALCALAAAPWISGCNDGEGVLLAKQVEDRSELVGGPVAMADIGDFLLQNDQIRVNILNAKDSPGPGVFGGSIVDVDLRRKRLGAGDAEGRDRFAELFPVANLLVPDPKPGESSVTVLKDGSDGKEASIRVEGKGAFLFEALAILHDQKNLLSLLFPDVKTAFVFRTDYALKMGERHVTIRTTLMLDDSPIGCPDTSACPPCEFGLKGDEAGCASAACECADVPVPLGLYTESTSVFGVIFGDNQNDVNPPAKYRGGVVAGDFVFFGNQNDVFAPGIGYDEEKAVNEAIYDGRNTFQSPLTYDFVAASGGDISYGYFTDPKGGEPSIVNVPLFASAATAFLAAGKNCLFDTSDDAECDSKRAFTYERYLAVGDGDISSIAADVWKTRGTTTGSVKGFVSWASTGQPAPRAQVFVFRNAKPGQGWDSVDDLAKANFAKFGDYGLVNVINADVGVDLTLDGDFHAPLLPGDYAIVARSEDGMSLSRPEHVKVKANQEVVLAPELPLPATLDFRVVDETGALTPAKLTLVSLDDDGKPLERDGKRRVYMGDGRLGNGIRVVHHSPTGLGTIPVEPGRYRLLASRGPEYSAFVIDDLELRSGKLRRVDASIVREVDTRGWMSTDMHLHQTPSFDSGMALQRRMSTVVDEQVELAVPTDHDVQTDYGPTVREMFLEPYVSTVVSAETTTLEQGHFIGFPLAYDASVVPTHGSHDPTCQGAGEILDGLRAKTADQNITPFTIVAHPRDGFFGYIEQLGVDPFTMNRTPPTLEANNPVFRTASCDFDGMEIINGKRFDLVRTATVEEVVDWNRCRARVDAAKTESDLVGFCPEISAGMLATCKAGEPFKICQHRNRTALAWESTKRILIRTPEEQEALWSFPLNASTTPAGETLCDVAPYGDDPVPRSVAEQPCTYRSGHIDDYFRYLERGMLKTHVASSDSHSGLHEPGFPRTYFMSSTDSPAALRVADAVDSLRAGHAVSTYGPFIRADVGGKTFGDVAKVTKGGKVKLNLHIETASWFGVDRIEIYQNGHLVNVISPKSKPSDIVDFDGKIDLSIPDRDFTDDSNVVHHVDSWVVIVAMGLEDQNLLRPLSVDVPFGEVQLSKVTSDAFALVPVVNTLFSPIPTLPDWFPVPPYAVTNPIYLDTGNDGNYDAPLPAPPFCSKECDPNAPDCPDGQFCLPLERVCGIVIDKLCEHRYPWGASPEH